MKSSKRVVSWVSAEIFRQLIERAPMGVSIYHLEDPNDIKSLRFVAVNKAASVATGIDMSRFVGTLLFDSFPKILETGLPAIYKRAFKTGEAQQLPDVVYGDKHISERVFAVTALPLDNNCLAVLFTDITAQKRAEVELQVKIGELDQFSKIMTGRELAMIWLEKEVKDLRASSTKVAD